MSKELEIEILNSIDLCYFLSWGSLGADNINYKCPTFCNYMPWCLSMFFVNELASQNVLFPPKIQEVLFKTFSVVPIKSVNTCGHGKE